MNSVAVVCVNKGEVKLHQMNTEDPDDNEIQVRVHSSVISQGTERAFILNMDNTTGEYPHFPGYSVAGVVEKAGKSVSRFRVGDRVACNGMSHRSLGNIDEQWAICIPDSVSFEEAAFVTVGVISLQGVRKLRIELGESALSLGLGLIGQLAVQFSSINGALPAIGVDRVESRLEMAKACGADMAFNSLNDRWLDQLHAATDGKGADVVIESTGSPGAIVTAFEAVKKYGRVVLLGSTRGDSTVNFYKYVHKKAITVIGAHAQSNPLYESRPGFWTWQDDAACFMRLAENQRIHLQPLITHRVDWQAAEQVYEQVLSWNDNMVGIVINWQ